MYLKCAELIQIKIVNAGENYSLMANVKFEKYFGLLDSKWNITNCLLMSAFINVDQMKRERQREGERENERSKTMRCIPFALQTQLRVRLRLRLSYALDHNSLSLPLSLSGSFLHHPPAL